MAIAVEIAPGNFFPGYRDTSLLSSSQIKELERYHEDQKRGRKSEMRAAAVIQGQDTVEEVIRNEQFSDEDIRGRDLTVHLVTGDIVWVQVKSSQTGVSEFIKQIGNRLSKTGIHVPVREWLASQRLILLDGSRSRNDITKNFNNQLRRIQRDYPSAA